MIFLNDGRIYVRADQIVAFRADDEFPEVTQVWIADGDPFPLDIPVADIVTALTGDDA